MLTTRNGHGSVHHAFARARLARALVLAGLVSFAGVMPAAAQTTAFVGARVIDGRGKVLENATIVVRDGKIDAVGPAARTRVPPGTESVDAKGMTIMPGIVNAHGHLTGANGMRNDPNGYTRENLIRQLNTYAS